MMFVSMFGFLHRLLEIAPVYRLTQFSWLPTKRRYHALICKNIPKDPSRRVLEIGCGLGWARELFSSDYTGIDINPDYIQTAQRRLQGRFYVMDAAGISFARDSFDDAVSIATTHHLTDQELSSMVAKATEVARNLHIIDAILPIAPNSRFKTALFLNDRGRYARSFDRLRELVGRNAKVEGYQLMEGPMHDVCYIRASRI